MKRYSLIFIALLFGVSACKDKVEEPESADFSWYLSSDYLANQIDLSKANANPDTVRLSDQLYFVASSADANSYVVWTGEPGCKFEERNLADSLIKDTNNHVADKAKGLALATTDPKGRKIATYTYKAISEVGNPYMVYCTARNYDYKSGEYSEVTSKGFPIVVIDDQVDLWGSDPYISNATDYRIICKAWGKSGSKYKMISSGAGKGYEVIYEDPKAGIEPGLVMTFSKSSGVENLDSCQLVFKANNCIPIFPEGATWSYNTAGAIALYYWSVNLTGSEENPVKLTLKSQSAAADAKSGDPLTKDYWISAKLVD